MQGRGARNYLANFISHISSRVAEVASQLARLIAFFSQSHKYSKKTYVSGLFSLLYLVVQANQCQSIQRLVINMNFILLSPKTLLELAENRVWLRENSV